MIESTKLVWGDLAGQVTQVPSILNLQVGDEVYLDEDEVKDKPLTVSSRSHQITKVKTGAIHTLVVVLS